ncbi:MAG: alpha/beta fold hydrolase [Lachnospiraceae bacterium]|nr:alpha/beta fold hydrolase [Lachnospiraceae bacterium]
MDKTAKSILKTVGAVTGIAAALYCFKRINSYLATRRNLLRPDEKEYYPWKFGKMAYTVTGKGRPVVLLHGIRADACGYEWHDFGWRLAADRTVYVLDLPGFGCSDKGNAVYTNYLFADALRAFLKDVVKEKADIITSGDSSSAALAASTIDPERIGSIIMINPEKLSAIDAKTALRFRVQRFLLDIPVIGGLIYEGFETYSAVRLRFNKDYFHEGLKAKDNHIQSFREAAHLGGDKAKFAFMNIHSGYTRNDTARLLSKASGDGKDLYIIGGEHFPEINETIKDYQKLDRFLKFKLVPGTKGLPHMERPDYVGELCKICLRIK